MKTSKQCAIPLLPALMLPALLVLAACSDTIDSDSAGSGLAADAQGQGMAEVSGPISALNYESRLSASMSLFRLEGVDPLIRVVDGIVEVRFAPLPETVTGTLSIDCPLGGTATRSVSEAPVFGDARVPELRVRSTIAFESCIIDSGELDGTLSYDWDLSSPASRSATQWTTAYGFSDMRFTQRDESITVTGNVSKRVTVTGTSESYLYSADVSRLTQVYQGETDVASNIAYEQSYNHAILQEGAPDGVVHRFAESGEATIEQADGDFAGQIRLAPTVVYGNNTEVGVLFHTAGGWDSGEISLTSTEGSSLLIQPGSSIESLLFQLTDSDGNETLIEREWFVSASCRGEEEFQLSLCLPI